MRFLKRAFFLRHALLTWSWLFALSTTSNASTIERYEVAQELCNGGKVFATRHFLQDGNPKYLIIHTESLKTEIVDPEALIACSSVDLRATDQNTDHNTDHTPLRTTTLGAALSRYNKQHSPLSACQGFHSFPSNCLGKSALVLTSDLCPSSKTTRQWDEEVRPFLNNLEKISHRNGLPTPIVLSASGAWLKSHQRELAILKTLNLEITWANHSETHGLLPNDHRNEENAFLTQKSLSEFKQEVLSAEKTMLENDLVPSVYFRFPGLYSKAEQVRTLREELSLLPLNSSAWLALDHEVPSFFENCGMSQDQAPLAGRVILTHANGNELLGIRRADSLLVKMEQMEKTEQAEQNHLDFISAEAATRCDLGRQ